MWKLKIVQNTQFFLGGSAIAASATRALKNKTNYSLVILQPSKGRFILRDLCRSLSLAPIGVWRCKNSTPNDRHNGSPREAHDNDKIALRQRFPAWTRRASSYPSISKISRQNQLEIKSLSCCRTEMQNMRHTKQAS